MLERDAAGDPVEIRAQLAALCALQLGWVALEPFIFLVAEVPDDQRDTVRDRVKTLIGEIAQRGGVTAREV